MPLTCEIIVYGLTSTMNRSTYPPDTGISRNELYILSHEFLERHYQDKNKLLLVVIKLSGKSLKSHNF